MTRLRALVGAVKKDESTEPTRWRRIRWIAVAAGTSIVAVSGLHASAAIGQPGAAAKQTPVPPTQVAGPVVGLVSGQELRVSVSSPAEGSCIGRGGRLQPSSSAISILAESGESLADFELRRVPAGGFGTVAVDRGDLTADGEEGTGRLQVGVRVEVTCPGGSVPDPTATPTATTEIVNTGDGRSEMALLIPAIQK